MREFRVTRLMLTKVYRIEEHRTLFWQSFFKGRTVKGWKPHREVRLTEGGTYTEPAEYGTLEEATKALMRLRAEETERIARRFDFWKVEVQ